jgi:exonuclease VII large subunit
VPLDRNLISKALRAYSEYSKFLNETRNDATNKEKAIQQEEESKLKNQLDKIQFQKEVETISELSKKFNTLKQTERAKRELSDSILQLIKNKLSVHSTLVENCDLLTSISSLVDGFNIIRKDEKSKMEESEKTLSEIISKNNELIDKGIK